jgi:hypothetical protein
MASAAAITFQHKGLVTVAKNYINAGTASATNGLKTVTFSGVDVSLFQPGNDFRQTGGTPTIIDSVDPDANTVTLANNWDGDSTEDQPYTVVSLPLGASLQAATLKLAQYFGGPIMTIAALTGDAFPDDGYFLVTKDSDWSRWRR